MTNPANVLLTPPRPKMVFRVGILGHRPDRLDKSVESALLGTVSNVLEAVNTAARDFYASHGNLFRPGGFETRAYSPLAEGVDRLFAEAALEAGYTLCCPMPFTREEFERDFADGSALEAGSLARFQNILKRASDSGVLTTFELDGDRASGGRAYGACGRVVLGQSDLLIVVWDGERRGKVGGTEDTFDEARRRGTPVLWIDAREPKRWQIIIGPRDSLSTSGGRSSPVPGASLDSLVVLVNELLALPAPASEDEAEISIEDYYTEKKPRLGWPVWKLFRDLLGHGRVQLPSLVVPDFEKAVERDWPASATTPVARVIDRLRPYYAWSDKLADCYGNAYRSVFVLAYLLAAVSVFAAVLPLATDWYRDPESHGFLWCGVIEVLCMCTIISLVTWSRLGRFHGRWIEYRFAAEMLRHLSLIGALGGGRPAPQIQAHLAGYRLSGWVAWYVRAVERELGLPDARVDSAFLQFASEHLTKMLDGQARFHKTTADRSHRIEKILHYAGISLAGITLLCGVVHLCPAHWHSWIEFVHEHPLPFTAIAAFFPALGAALAGIANQAEFRRVAKRSHAMTGHLKTLADRAGKVSSQIKAPGPAQGTQHSVAIADLATDAASLMVNEVLDWRVVFLDRPTELAV